MIHGTGWIALLNGWQALWWDAMIRVCLSGTLALCIAFLLSRLFTQMQAGVRCWIWRLAFLKLFLAFLCAISISVPILPKNATPIVSSIDTRNGIRAPEVHPGDPTFSTNGSDAGDEGRSAQGVTVSGLGQTIGGFLSSVLPLLWCIGVVFCLVRILRQYRDAMALVSAACPVSDPAILQQFVQTSRNSGLYGSPDLYVSDLTDVPLLFGLRRPIVVLPAVVVTEFSADDCCIMLAHELAHVKRYDLPWSFLAGLAEMLFFFHPLVWWAHRELRMAQEICCDELAIRSVSVTAHAYGTVLVRVAAKSTITTQDRLIAVAMAESPNTIQRRLKAMQTFRLNTGWKRWAPMMVAAVGGVALLPWRLEAQSGASRQKPADAKAIQAGGYSLRIVPVANVGGGGGNFFSSGGSNGSSFSFGGGGSVSGSSSGGGGSTGGPGSASVTSSNSFRSNQTLGLDITGRNKEDLLLINGVENLRGVDDQGRTVRGPEMPSMSMFSPILRPADGKREILFLQTEEGAKALKTLEGDLIVANGVIRTVTFAASEVRPGASKRVGQVTVTIDSVRETDNGYELSVSCESPRTEQARDIREQMKMMTQGFRSAEAELVGTNGVAYPPNTMGGGAGGGNGFVSGFSSSGGGNFSTSRTFGDDTAGTSASKSSFNMSFQQLPDGVRPRSLVVRVIERHGANKRVPFKFNDVSLGEKDKG